jgi:hypothetical protein
MQEHVNREQYLEFEDRGRRWARCMLHRLEQHWLDIPLVWPGTREQAETIVHAFTSESMDEVDRENFVEAVQSGARVGWRHLSAEARDKSNPIRATGT